MKTFLICLLLLVAPLAKAQNYNLGPILTNITVSLQCDQTGAAYAVGDTWCNMVTLTNALRVNGGTGRIVSVAYLSADNTAPQLSLLFFSQPFTVGLSNAAWAVTTAQMSNCVAHVEVYNQDFIPCGINRMAIRSSIGLPVKNGNASRNLYVGIVAQSTDAVTNAPQIVVGISQD